MDLLLIALQEMDREIKEKRREWEKQGGREDQIDRSNYLDGFWHAWQIANRVHTNSHPNVDGSSNGWRWLGVQNTFAGQTKMEADSQKISLRFDEQME